MSEIDVWPLVRSGLLSPAPTALPAVTVQLGSFSVPPGHAETLDAQRVAFKVPAGERDVVRVATPEQQRTKHKRR